MKYMILNITCLLGLSLSFAACSDDDHPIITNKQLDQNAFFVNAPEPNSYQLYYKPAVGYVGDPMPFFDPNSKEFRILYLQDWRDGADTFHPIHCVGTTDAASYISYGEAIPCGSIGEQDPALGTGSTVYKDGVYYTFYTGHNHKATSEQPKEAVLVATSTDFKTWTKDRSFRLDAPEGYSRDDFRDPHVFYDEDASIYRMLICTKRGGTAVIAQFTSTDLYHWTVTEPFFYNVWGRFYECPDVFKMGNYWYMIYSDKDITRQVQYFYAPTLAELQRMGDANFPPNEGKLEGTAYYAAKTASDGTNRYAWGWCFTRNGKDNAGTGDWAGSLVAHRLVQLADGTLGFDAPEAVKSKFTQQRELTEMNKTTGVSHSGSTYILNAGNAVRFARLDYNAKITMKVKAPANNEAVFGLSFVDCDDKDVKYNVYIEARWNGLKFDKVTLDKDTNEETRKNINFQGFKASPDGVYHIEVYTEESVCVVYVNGQYAFTNRIYNMQRNPWGIFASDGTVEISDIELSTY